MQNPGEAATAPAAPVEPGEPDRHGGPVGPGGEPAADQGGGPVAAAGLGDPEAGMVTAEYAIATLAAAAFAGVLLLVLRSPEVRAFLLGIIRQALSV